MRPELGEGQRAAVGQVSTNDRLVACPGVVGLIG
jgi:hypothetical protein